MDKFDTTSLSYAIFERALLNEACPNPVPTYEDPLIEEAHCGKI
jgi:hypothetical protein